MVIKSELIKIIEQFKSAGNENAIFDAHLILKHFLKLSSMDLVLEKNKEIDDLKLKEIDAAVLRCMNDEPIQYVLNSQEFMGLDFYVDKNVLIPRSDTETLVEHILTHFGKEAFTGLDIGVGSGCISISLAHYSKNSLMRGIDISRDAVAIANRNAKSNNVDDRVCFEVADVYSYQPYGKYDLVVSNPPYIETDIIKTLDNNVKSYEPYIALDGGKDGLDFYRYIIKTAPKFLKANGMLAFEIGYNQSKAVSQLMKECFDDIKVIKDYQGNDRVVSGIIK